MKHWILPLVVLGLTTNVALARPYPDRATACYVFEKDTQQKVLPCVVSSGYGSGEHYMALTWPDGSQLVYREDSQSHMGTLNDQPAKSFMRNATFMDVIKEPPPRPDEGTLKCFMHLKATTNYCYQDKF